MPERILQVDLGKDARDFVGVSLNDLPILDKSNANDRKLRKVLGRLAAQPERKGDRISFFVCDEAGGRPHEVLCEPANERELRTNKDLKSDLELLEQRIGQIENEELRNTLVRHFNEIRNSGPAHQAFHFCKWKTPGGVWRLVWLWGFQRKDLEPAPPIICTDPHCRTLFAKRASDPHCPVCSGKGAGGKKPGDRPPKNWKKILALGAVCVLLLALGIGVWVVTHPASEPPPVTPAGAVAQAPKLIATPVEWSGPVGALIDFRVLLGSEDVTDRIVARSDSPKVVQLHRSTALAVARSPGTCVITFYLGAKYVRVTLRVDPPRNPKRLTLEPGTLTLGVGATSRLRLVGEYADGSKVDLTGAASWGQADSDAVFVHRGILEGVKPGRGVVQAMYRAAPGQPWLEAATNVEVIDEAYESLSISLERSELAVQQVTGVKVEAVTKGGTRYSVSESSKLQLSLSPTQVARVEDGLLYADQPGKVKLQAEFEGLTAEANLTVISSDGVAVNSFAVAPSAIELVVGETSELQVHTSSNSPIEYASSTPKVVEVTGGGRIIGRAPGSAVIVVSQDGNRAEINVDVSRTLFTSIAIVPERVSVAVDETFPIRVVGISAGGERVDLAADQIQAERLPSSSFVDFDPSTLTLRGMAATGSSPQTLTLRVGDQRATAKIEVVSAPFQLVTTPEGSVDVPVGQSAQVQVWARYGDGRRVEVLPNRVDWAVSPEPSTALAFDKQTGTATAHTAGGAPLEVTAGYQSESTVPVSIIAVAPPPQKLEFDAFKNPLVVGETGQFRALLVNADGTSVPASDVRFNSADPAKLTVSMNSGAYTALAAGDVTVAVGAVHLGRSGVVRQAIQIVDRDAGQLVLRPDKVQLPVGGKAELKLFLVSTHGEREIALPGNRNVELASMNQRAIDWQAPWLLGKQKTERPFEFAATWQGKTAKTLIEVLELDPSQTPTELRVVPDQVALAPGQPFSPKVEQKTPGNGGAWVEVQPTAVAWNYPAADLIWTPPSTDLRPELSVRAEAPDQVSLQARYNGGSATLTITKKLAADVPAATDEDARLVVEREPAGESIAAPNKQRYTIVVDKAGEQQPAVNIDWLPPFQNEYVSWNPPVLTARRGSHVQRLSATVDGERIEFDTRIDGVSPSPSNDVPVTDEKPTRVRITSPEGPQVKVPVGSEFSDFAVEAEFASGSTRDVTRQAQLTTIGGGPGNAAVAVSTGRITGLRLGAAVVQAEFHGVASTDGLAVEVIGPQDITSIEIEPAELELAVGETIGLRAIAYAGEGENRVPRGVVSSAAGLVWESREEEVVRVAGDAITALKEGTATVIAKLGTATAAATVTVQSSETDLDDEIRIVPESLVLRVGESKSIGGDISVRRGGIDLTPEADVSSSQPETVRVDRDTRSLVGISPGTAQVAVTYGGQRRVLPVSVEAAQEPTGELRVVIEPSSALLAIGQSQRVRVFLVDAAGARTDRTASAVFESSDPAVIEARGADLTGRGAGTATISAALPDSSEAATAQFTVEDVATENFEVLPNPLTLALGEERPLRIQAVGPGGGHDISDHADLLIVAGGNNPEAVELNGRSVRGVRAGEATIDVSLGSTTKKVAVTVGDQSWSDLRIEPAEATIAVGENRSFLVFAKRGTQERSLSPDDGVEVRLSDTTAARVEPPFTIVGTSPGFTSLRVRLGDLRAEAKITVTASDRPEPPATPPVLPPGLRFIPDVLTLQLGTPGASVRVVKVSADGTEEDVDHETQMTFEGPSDVVDMKWTASGAVFKPLKVGATSVAATHEDTPTRRPLAVRVVDRANDPRLEVRPNPISLNVGETQEFQRVQIHPGRGITPVDTDYRVISSDPGVVAVENNRLLRAVAAGQTTVRVTPADVEPRFQSVGATVPVQVSGSVEPDVAADEDQPQDEDEPTDELILSGPSRTTVGATAQFAVELVTANGSKDVTSDGASLVVDRDQADLLQLIPGGAVVGKQPSTVSIKARYKNLISAPVALLIEPVATQFARLEIEIDKRPLTVSESRPYKLWGYPQNGSSPQDLTNAVNPANGQVLATIKLSPETGIAEHQPPTVIGKTPGEFKMSAAFPPSLGAEVGPLEVVDSDGEDIAILSVQPAAISVRVGEPAPPVKVLARRPGERKPREIDLPLTSQDPSILQPAADRFIGKEIGQTSLLAEHNGQTVAVDVNVHGNPFDEVKIGRPDFVSNTEFVVMIQVTGTMPEGTEYRTLMDGDGGSWKPAQSRGGKLSVSLTSPRFTFDAKNNEKVYSVYLESRSPSDGATERFPCSFRIEYVTRQPN